MAYVQGVIAQAGMNAHTALERLLEVVSLSGVICVDEVYLKELGSREKQARPRKQDGDSPLQKLCFQSVSHVCFRWLSVCHQAPS